MKHALSSLVLGLISGAAYAEPLITECPYLFPGDGKTRLHLAEMLHWGDSRTVDTGDGDIAIAPKLIYTPHVYGDKGGFEGAVLVCRYGTWGRDVPIRLPIPGYMIRYDTVLYDPGGIKHPIYLRAWATSVVKKGE